MIDFGALRVAYADPFDGDGDFIGLEYNGEDAVLRLPWGLPIDDLNASGAADLRRQWFWTLFKSVLVFERDWHQKSDTGESSPTDNPYSAYDLESKGRGVQVKSNQAAAPTSEEGPIFFRSFHGLVDLLAVIDDPNIAALGRRLGRTDNPPFNSLNRNLHKAVFLDNDVALIEEAEILRACLVREPTELVQLFCFLVREVLSQMEEPPPSWCGILAEQFGFNHDLHLGDLFNAERSEQTLMMLQDLLEEIVIRTPVRDEDFWRLHRVIFPFLNPYNRSGDKRVLGIGGCGWFWEAVCLSWLQAHHDGEIACFDEGHTRVGQTGAQLRYSRQFGWLRPDAIVVGSDGTTIIDAKYVQAVGQISQEARNKQLAYHLIQMLIDKSAVPRTELWIPGKGAEVSERPSDLAVDLCSAKTVLDRNVPLAAKPLNEALAVLGAKSAAIGLTPAAPVVQNMPVVVRMVDATDAIRHYADEWSI